MSSWEGWETEKRLCVRVVVRPPPDASEEFPIRSVAQPGASLRPCAGTAAVSWLSRVCSPPCRQVHVAGLPQSR